MWFRAYFRPDSPDIILSLVVLAKTRYIFASSLLALQYRG
jgi:hypothetical protein